MLSSHTEPSYRAISVIALIQAGVVIGGTLFVTVMLKLAGYRGGAVPDTFFNSAALFVRHWGFLLLLLPVAWAVCAVIVTRTTTERWTSLSVLLLGIGAILFGIFQYILLGLNPAIL